MEFLWKSRSNIMSERGHYGNTEAPNSTNDGTSVE